MAFTSLSPNFHNAVSPVLGRWLSIWLLLVFTHACSHNPFNAAAKLSHQLDNKQFDEAIMTYDSMKPEQQAGFKRKLIVDQRESFILQELKLARQAISKEQWREAKSILVKALDKTPSSKNLQTELIVLEQRMGKLQRQYKAQLLLHETRSYLDRQAIDNKWQNTSSHKIPFQHPAFETEDERKDLAQLLADYGFELLDKKSNKGYIFLDVANQLSPHDEWQGQLDSVKKAEARAKTKSENKKDQLRQVAFKNLQKSYQDHIESRAFKSAQTSLKEARHLARTSSDKQWLATANEQLQNKINRSVQNYIKQGQVQYSKGNIDKAIEAWNKGLALDPENRTIKDSLSRANKFKETYDRLKQ